MSLSKVGKDFTIKAIITVKNPTKYQLSHFTNVIFTCRNNLVNNRIIIDDIYKSDDYLQNLYAIEMLSIYDMSNEILETIKKPYPYKRPS
jgi:hypothetical protein